MAAPFHELPHGTVTFLFTDIEGSTRLLKGLRDRYGDVLAEHHRILRAAFAEAGGQEIDMAGDGFFVAFSRAADAVATAVNAQRALAEHSWPEPFLVRVRMGLHSGEPRLRDGRYVGLGVHRAARIMGAGHGGQVLMSNATRELIEDELPDGVALRDLGEHQLKDLERPERIYQLEIDGLPSDFPALRTESTATGAGAVDGLVDQGIGPPAWRTRKGLFVLVAGGVVVAAALAAVLAGGGSSQAVVVRGSSLAMIDARTGTVQADVAVGSAPGQVAAGPGAVWAVSPSEGTVSRIDPRSRSVVQTIPVGNAPTGIAVGGGSVWVANSLDGTLSRISPTTNQVVQTIPLGNDAQRVAFGEGAVWVTDAFDRKVVKLDPANGTVIAKIPTGAEPTGIAVGDGAVWLSNEANATVSRLDPRTDSIVQPINVGNGPTAIAAGPNAVWVVNALDGTVSRIDPANNAVSNVYSVGSNPQNLIVTTEGVWVTSRSGELSYLRAHTNAFQRIRIAGAPTGVAFAEGSLWVAVQDAGTRHRGGTLRLAVVRGGIDSIDPALAYGQWSWQTLVMTGDGLVGFRRVGGTDGAALVPDLATALPVPTANGTIYTFQLRPGIRYSNGVAVKPEDFRHTIERDFKAGSPRLDFYAGILGAPACAKTPRSCDLSRGIVTDAATRTVTFHLSVADPEFLYKLALPFAFTVPPATPDRAANNQSVPGTGPYKIARYQPNRLLELVRNPYFHEWSSAAQPAGFPDRILWSIVPNTTAANEANVTAVEHGKEDWLSSPPPDRLAELATQYPSQIHAHPQPSTLYLLLNTKLPPFNQLGVRRALSFAFDRHRLLQAYGGPRLAQPTCQILPPNFPGYRPYCPYTLNPATGNWTAPDLAKARRLIQQSRTQGTQITVWTVAVTPFLEEARIARSTLRELGYPTTLKIISSFKTYAGAIHNPSNRIQIASVDWIADYLAPSNFIGPFGCASYHHDYFCDPTVDRAINGALHTQTIHPQRANDLWASLDHAIVDLSPAVPVVNPKTIDIVSTRLGNYQYNPEYSVLLDQLWVH
jgi:YVTN family beta-propeller protein